MKATGMVRRVDDLGRIIIPKEIRRQVKIHEGDPMEFFLLKKENKTMVVLSIYEPNEDTDDESEDADACERESLGDNWW